MFGKVVLCFSTLHIYRTMAQGKCSDVRGTSIPHGLHYVPGPDNCRLCICDNGHPTDCKVVLCSPPKDCRSFHVGKSCCEFICLDDVTEANDASFRMAAGGLAGIVLLCLILLLFRIKAQKRRRPPHTDDSRSLTSIGYISGSMGYMGSMCETGLSAWKPPNNYMPRGEAPPPYDEAVAQSRAEAMRFNNETAFNRNYPASVESLTRPEDTVQYAGHNYINLPRPMHQVANNQSNCFNAPLLRSVHNVEVRDPPVSIMHHPLDPNVSMGFPGAIRLTGSLGTITNRGLLSLLHRQPIPDHERPHNVPGFYTNTNALAMHSSFHRTIPRISTAIDATVLDTPISNFNRDRSLHNEIRRSFHKPNENNRHLTDTGRSMPRNLNLASSSDVNQSRPRLHEEAIEMKCTKSIKPALPTPAETAIVATQSTLPLTVDKPSCVCSYEDTTPQGAEEADDYRNECENCKSASSSRWVLEEGWSETEQEGTQTLQRRNPPPPAPPPAASTLPQPVTKQRTIMGPSSNWENWFSTIPDSDTESEED